MRTIWNEIPIKDVALETLLSKINELNHNIGFISSESYYATFIRESETLVSYVPPINRNYLAHELLHALVNAHLKVGSEKIFEVIQMNIQFPPMGNKESFRLWMNNIAHISFYPHFVEFGFNISDFLTNQNEIQDIVKGAIQDISQNKYSYQLYLSAFTIAKHPVLPEIDEHINMLMESLRRNKPAFKICNSFFTNLSIEELKQWKPKMIELFRGLKELEA